MRSNPALLGLKPAGKSKIFRIKSAIFPNFVRTLVYIPFPSFHPPDFFVMSKLVESEPNNSKGVQFVQVAVVAVVAAIAAYLVFSYLIWPIIWWILAILGVLLMAINYKMMFRIFRWYTALYKKNTWLGVAATVGGFLAFTPFVVFLFVKTIWDFRSSPLVGGGDKKKAETIGYEEVEDPKLPPTHLDKRDSGLFQ